GAGSVITQSVSDDALALGRGRQTEKPGWAAKFRESKGALGKGTVIRQGDKAFRVTITRSDGTILPTGPSTLRIAPPQPPPKSPPATLATMSTAKTADAVMPKVRTEAVEPSMKTSPRTSGGSEAKARKSKSKTGSTVVPKARKSTPSRKPARRTDRSKR